MEEFDLYPGDDMHPASVADGYTDYWLSDIVGGVGGFVKTVKLAVRWSDCRIIASVKLGRVVDGESLLLWRGGFASPCGTSINPDAGSFVSGGAHSWTDLKLRYLRREGDGESLPACVAAKCNVVHGATGKHIDAYLDFFSGERYWSITDM